MIEINDFKILLKQHGIVIDNINTNEWPFLKKSSINKINKILSLEIWKIHPELLTQVCFLKKHLVLWKYIII